MSKKIRWAALGAGIVAISAGAVPASAQSGTVTVSLNTSGPSATGRTLMLYDTAGQALSALDLSTGTKSFVAQVSDSGYSLNGFNVQASMSNLYGYYNSAWNCSAVIPASAVSLTSPSSLLDVSGLSSGLTPQFVLNGTLTTVLGPLLTTLGLGSAVVTNAPVTGLAQTLSQASLAAGNTGQLVGSTVSSLSSSLPLQAVTGAGGAFTNPAADPSGANCGQSGSSATNVPVMSSTANAAGISVDLQGLLAKLPNMSATQLITAGYLDSNSVMSAVSTVLNIPLNLLTPYVSSIENTLIGSLAGTPLATGLTSDSGSYSSSPAVTVNTSGVPAGSYKGTMTITEVG